MAQYRPEIHHSDHGVQYASPVSFETLQGVIACISMATIGEATENGYAERLMRTVKEEEVTLHDSADFDDAYQCVGCFLGDVYQHKRTHSALATCRQRRSNAAGGSRKRSACL